MANQLFCHMQPNINIKLKLPAGGSFHDKLLWASSIMRLLEKMSCCSSNNGWNSRDSKESSQILPGSQHLRRLRSRNKPPQNMLPTFFTYLTSEEDMPSLLQTSITMKTNSWTVLELFKTPKRNYKLSSYIYIYIYLKIDCNFDSP